MAIAALCTMMILMPADEVSPDAQVARENASESDPEESREDNSSEPAPEGVHESGVASSSEEDRGETTPVDAPATDAPNTEESTADETSDDASRQAPQASTPHPIVPTRPSSTEEQSVRAEGAPVDLPAAEPRAPSPPPPLRTRGLLNLGASVLAGGGSMASLTLSENGIISLTGGVEVLLVDRLTLGAYAGWGRRSASERTYDRTASISGDATVIVDYAHKHRQWLFGLSYLLNPGLLFEVSPFIRGGRGTTGFDDEIFDRTATIGNEATVDRIITVQGTGAMVGADVEAQLLNGLWVRLTLTLLRGARITLDDETFDRTVSIDRDVTVKRTSEHWAFSGTPAASVELRLAL